MYDPKRKIIEGHDIAKDDEKVKIAEDKKQPTMSIILREEIDPRFVQLRKNQKLQTLFWNATERVRFKFPGT